MGVGINHESTGNHKFSLTQLMFMISGLCCNFQPCDAADVQELTTQEKEETTCDLLKSKNGMYYSEPLIRCEIAVFPFVAQLRTNELFLFF